MKLTAYLPEHIFTGDEWLQDHAVIVQDGFVQSVISASALADEYHIHPLPNVFLAPAFIDIQIYGAQGKLLAVYPNADALQALYDYCYQGGAALFLPTVATNSLAVFHQCIDAVKSYWQQGGKGVYGLHLEGPWINPAKKGAHIEACIHPPTMQEVKDLLSYGKGVVKMITLAPEVCTPEVIAYLQSQNIIISAGHSNATYEQAWHAFEAGIPAVTHLYNAMSALQHRSPGLVGATFNHPSVRSSIIPDGHHVDYAAIRIAKKVMGRRLFAITDAVTETASGPYQHQLEGDKYVSSGILSGSALTMYKAFYNLVKQVDIEVEEALRMCSLYPAQVLRKDDLYGKIAPGYTAQFVALTKQLELSEVITG